VAALPSTRRCFRVVKEAQDIFTILPVIAVLMLLGAVRAWPHRRNWGYGPRGGLGLELVILLVLVLTGRL
jgi:hypothetical protein